MKHITIILVLVTVALTGCENPLGSIDMPEVPDYDEYLTENSWNATAMEPVIIQPAFVPGGIDVPVGTSLVILVKGGTAPFTWEVSPSKGQVYYAPEDGIDAHRFVYVAQRTGDCLVQLVDRNSKVAYFEVENIK